MSNQPNLYAGLTFSFFLLKSLSQGMTDAFTVRKIFYPRRTSRNRCLGNLQCPRSKAHVFYSGLLRA